MGEKTGSQEILICGLRICPPNQSVKRIAETDSKMKIAHDSTAPKANGAKSNNAVTPYRTVSLSLEVAGLAGTAGSETSGRASAALIVSPSRGNSADPRARVATHRPRV